MKKIGSICVLCIIMLYTGCSYAERKEDSGETKQPEKTLESETAVDNVTEADQKEEESEQTMKTNDINIEEIRQTPSGTMVTADQLASLDIQQMFYKEEITAILFERIYGKSYKENCTIPQEELAYLRVLHIGFDGETHIGEIMVSQEIAEDILEIFQALYEAQYPIEKMKLIDDYDADDEASMEDNNTSGFNYRTISHSDQLSNHSYGKAVDINPRYNPYVKTVNGDLSCEPANGSAYIDRTAEFPYKIDENDLCYQVFKEHGFSWGGAWSSAKDYQHFEK